MKTKLRIPFENIVRLIIGGFVGFIIGISIANGCLDPDNFIKIFSTIIATIAGFIVLFGLGIGLNKMMFGD